MRTGLEPTGSVQNGKKYVAIIPVLDRVVSYDYEFLLVLILFEFPTWFTNDIASRHPHVIQEDLRRVRTSHAHLVYPLGQVYPGRVHGDADQ